MQICFLSARRFASLLLTFSRFSLILFLTVVLATATFFFTELSHLEQLFILDTSLATGWKNYFGTYYAYLLFFVLRMFAIDLGTIVKVISRSPDSLGFIFLHVSFSSLFIVLIFLLVFCNFTLGLDLQLV